MARPATSSLPKVEDLLAIDIARLRRSGIRTAGASGDITWSRSSTTASVGYVLHHDGIRLHYTLTRHGCAPQRIDDFIPIVMTPTRFGGQRHWFQCPTCGRRCRLIYGGSHFRCRTCYRLRYASQYESEPLRISRQRWQMRRRLERLAGEAWPHGLDEGFPPKPRYMRWATYRRFEALDRELANRWRLGIASWLKRTDPKRLADKRANRALRRLEPTRRRSTHNAKGTLS